MNEGAGDDTGPYDILASIKSMSMSTLAPLFNGMGVSSRIPSHFRRLISSAFSGTSRKAARLYMIDHTQAFREKIELQEEFEQNRVWLSEELYSRLLALDKERLNELLANLTTR